MSKVNNDDLIRSIFSPGATDEAKAKALAVLEGRGDPEIPSGPLLLTMGEACKLIPCSRATLWRIIKSGRLPKVEIYPNAYRLRRSDILDLVNSRPFKPSKPEARHG